MCMCGDSQGSEGESVEILRSIKEKVQRFTGLSRKRCEGSQDFHTACAKFVGLTQCGCGDPQIRLKEAMDVRKFLLVKLQTFLEICLIASFYYY